MCVCVCTAWLAYKGLLNQDLNEKPIEGRSGGRTPHIKGEGSAKAQR